MDCQKIGNIISKGRKEKNMTQKEVADLLNISDRTVSKWERGIGCPDISLMIPLSKVLDIGLYELLGGEEMEKDSKVKANKVIENTIGITEEKIKRQSIIDKIVIVISLSIVLVISVFWLFTKYHYMILYAPSRVKGINLIELNELFKKNECTLTLENHVCYLMDGTFVSIPTIEIRAKLPKWYANGAFHGFDIDVEQKQLSMSIGNDGQNEDDINNYQIFNSNYTKKSMIVTSLAYFLFIEDIEKIYYDFNNTSYLIEKEEIEILFEKKYAKLDDLLKDDNWNKYVIKKLKDKDYINEFFRN